VDTAHRFLQQSRAYLTEEYLPKIEGCISMLTEDEVWHRPNQQSNSVGNLLLHLAGNIRQWILTGVCGESDVRDRPSEFAATGSIPRVDLLSSLRVAVGEVDAALQTLDPAELLTLRTVQGYDVLVIDAIYHVVEHFSMHTGQVVWITKSLTGRDLRFYDDSGARRRPWTQSPDS